MEATDVLAEALVLSLATELLMDFASESDVLSIIERLTDLLVESDSLIEVLYE
ncbi:hypothetical protein [Fructilactobacillus cliffordii]|uniref:Uncharacterized protein n=1 Tax=Fructilactobacillus cliffordii TaxID=2940299 RepID=A0A9Q8ZNF3_9LACO|nr:hypothetical protein [Fructilactobacillus cliffordii]USS86903.1 hypothetical protein M3M38_02235 [Fructilactobacillus cliffordii]USS88630.1 hypothetical protein M3M40_03780 [Fructilactobacillus cliffordii]